MVLELKNFNLEAYYYGFHIRFLLELFSLKKRLQDFIDLISKLTDLIYY